MGAALGFSLTIPPGPMNALIASIAPRSLRAGILTGVGAMSADLVLGAAVYGLNAVVDLHAVVRALYVLGAATMLYLGVRLLQRRNRPAPPLSDTATYARAFGVGITNPFQILWWLTAGVAFAYLGGAVLLIGLFGAIAVWVVVFPTAIHAGSRENPRIQVAILYVSAALMIGFAAYFAGLAALES